MTGRFSSPSPTYGASSSGSTGENRAHKDQPRIRRRNRLITSCLECRRRKLKCDKQQPHCTNCTRFSRECLFITPALDPASQAKIAEVKEKMGMLERSLEQDVARRSGNKSTSPLLLGLEDNISEDNYEEEEELRGLGPCPLGIDDCAFYDEDDDYDEGSNDLVDIGVSMGKLKITERIGGFLRSRLSEEISVVLKDLSSREDRPNPFIGQPPESWMTLGNDYIPPSSSFFFSPGLHKTSLMTYLPSQALVDKLMEQYWKAVHIIARTVHRPSFERQYNRFWADISSGIEPRTSFQAVIFAALLSSVISMSTERVLTGFGVAKDCLVENFKQGAEAALAKANFLRTTKLETLQALVMYLIPLCRGEVSRAHSALTGTAIRLAECMSLHRDPSYYTSNPVEIHIRRLIWHQLCFLDLRTCESTGPRPQIRREEHDTQFPVNIDDMDLESGVDVTEDRRYFTDMTITRMRFECYEMHRMLWTERPNLEAKKTTLTSLLSRIQKFCQAMEKTYLPLLQKDHPFHVLALSIYGILSNRMYIAVLQRFISRGQRLMPEQLRQLAISTAVMTLEHSMTIEQTPALAEWAWYVGALHQYHAALLLLTELYAKPPDPAVEARAWRSLDFVFDLPAAIPGTEKARMVLEGIIGRTETYQAARRMRSPPKTEAPCPRAQSTEYQRREAERNREFRSPSATSSSAASTSSHHYPHPHQQPHMGRLGQMPSVDYAFALAPADNAAAANLQCLSASDHHEAHGFAGYATSSSAPCQPQLPASVASHMHNMQRPSGSAAMGALGAMGGSPLDAMPDIDWNEWDELFGTAEMSMSATASIMIPPLTFPQLATSDLVSAG